MNSLRPSTQPFRLALVPPPSAIVGDVPGEGERNADELLNELLDSGVRLLRNRRIPGMRSPVDLIAVTASGVWVVAANRDGGGVDRGISRLVIGGYDRTLLADAVRRQVEHVQRALGPMASDAGVNGALCLLEARWRFFGRPFSVDDIQITSPQALVRTLTEPGTLRPTRLERIERWLCAAFPPAASSYQPG